MGGVDRGGSDGIDVDGTGECGDAGDGGGGGESGAVGEAWQVIKY